MNNIRRALEELQGPDPEAEDRAWRLVRSAYVRRPVPGRSPRRWRLVVALAALLVLGVVLSSAGAGVLRLVVPTSPRPHTTDSPRTERTARPPGGGKLLALSQGRVVIVNGRQTTRLGPADEATFSPFGHYVAAAHRNRLTVYALDGRRVWSLLEHHPIFNLRWSPDGLRIAYRAGTTLRVVDGNGEHPRSLGPITGGAIAWRPGTSAVLSYTPTAERAVFRDTATDKVIARMRSAPVTTSFSWSADGARMVSRSPWALRFYDIRGRLVRTQRSRPGRLFLTATYGPTGRHLAVTVAEPRGTALILDRHVIPRVSPDAPSRPPVWSNDGRWLAVPTTSGHSRLISASHPRTTHSTVAGVIGWCCA